MRLPEWFIERGIGENRAVLIEDGNIVEAHIHLEGIIPAGSVVAARLTNVGTNGRNAIAIDEKGSEYLLPRGASGISEGGRLNLEVTRELIPGGEPWKRALGRCTKKSVQAAPPHVGQVLTLPAADDRLANAGWNELMDEARSAAVVFAGGELRISATPAMTLLDVDGHLPPDELAVRGAAEAARAIRRLDIGGSIGIDLPTVSGKRARQDAAAAIDAILPEPFERTAVNGFGFVQIVRPRRRASLVELALDRAAFEGRALLRRATFEPPGPKRLVGHPALIALLAKRKPWIDLLSRQIGGPVSLRADAALPMSGAYAEPL